MPFTSELLGNYADEAPSVIVYAASVLGVTVTFGAQIAYAYRRGLLKPEYRDAARAVDAPGVFAVAIVFAGLDAARAREPYGRDPRVAGDRSHRQSARRADRRPDHGALNARGPGLRRALVAKR